MIVINMEKARFIHKDNLRSIRKPKLEKLDLEFMKAIEQGNIEMQADIRVKKQALRDVTSDPIIEAAQTSEELKSAIPEILKD